LLKQIKGVGTLIALTFLLGKAWMDMPRRESDYLWSARPSPDGFLP
jgi:hypothetical protein